MKIYVIEWKAIKNVISIVLMIALMVCISVVTLYAVEEYIVAAEAKPDEKPIPTVIIDAGHGGEDPGAIGVSGAYEKDLNLEIAKLLAAMLKEEGFDVLMTREEDRMLYSPEENIKGMRKISDLKNRAKVANGQENAIFVSIHMNSFGEGKYSGLQVYYQKDSEDSPALASCIQSAVKAAAQPENNRVIKAGRGLYLLDKVNIPSVIIECGFLTNPEECEKLSQKEYQKQLSSAIVCGIIEYITKK
ncbi:MAG: N-acetylmuramoyl-L-alanine amidase [Clostridia bacterium]|nr:N-acetylmuramoyl-L-alanine amidase [Clostridia bacterium]